MMKNSNDFARGVDEVKIEIPERTHAPLAGVHSWHIPRPSLIPDSDGESRSSQLPRGSTSSQGSSSTTSTQSGASGSLLLTAANLASLRCEPLAFGAKRSLDTASLASSTHFTVVNGLERRRAKPLPSCCCKKHQLPVLVVAMSVIFLVALLAAVFCLEMRSRDIHLFT